MSWHCGLEGQTHGRFRRQGVQELLLGERIGSLPKAFAQARLCLSAKPGESDLPINDLSEGMSSRACDGEVGPFHDHAVATFVTLNALRCVVARSPPAVGNFRSFSSLCRHKHLGATQQI